MAKNENRRVRIKREYEENLCILNSMGILDIPDEYICPICTKEDSVLTKEDNPLTLEDVPPKSLGGKANVLTCKKCNNTLGYKVDVHLSNRLESIDIRGFYNNTEAKVDVLINDKKFKGIFSIDGLGVMQMHHSNKSNNPTELDEAMSNLKANDTIRMNIIDKKSKDRLIDLAILKIGYLMIFEKFGYSFILDSCYDDIRKQLMNPEKEIYRFIQWFQPPFPEEYEGVYFVMGKGYETIISIFTLKTEHLERRIAILLPIPRSPIGKRLNKILEAVRKYKNVEFPLLPHYQVKDGFLLEKDKIEMVQGFLNSINNTKI